MRGGPPFSGPENGEGGPPYNEAEALAPLRPELCKYASDLSRSRFLATSCSGILNIARLENHRGESPPTKFGVPRISAVEAICDRKT